MPREFYVIRGKRYPVPEPESWTFRERSEVKAFTGLRWREVERALAERDPDVEFILMRLAIERVEPGSELLATLAALPDGDWDLVREDDEEEDDELPPEEPAEAGDLEDGAPVDAGERIRKRANQTALLGRKPRRDVGGGRRFSKRGDDK